MVCTPEIWLRNPRNGAPVNPDLESTWGRFENGGGQVPTAANYGQIVRKNRMSDVLHPSNKVAFFLDDAVHDPDIKAWYEQGATCTLSTADGSSRATRPYTDALKGNPEENAGNVLELFFSDEGQTSLFDIPYISTFGGLRGRDLQ